LALQAVYTPAEARIETGAEEFRRQQVPVTPPPPEGAVAPAAPWTGALPPLTQRRVFAPTPPPAPEVGITAATAPLAVVAPPEPRGVLAPTATGMPAIPALPQFRVGVLAQPAGPPLLRLGEPAPVIPVAAEQPPIPQAAVPPAPREVSPVARAFGPPVELSPYQQEYLKSIGFQPRRDFYVYDRSGKATGRTVEEYYPGRHREISTHFEWKPREAGELGLTLDQRAPAAVQPAAPRVITERRYDPVTKTESIWEWDATSGRWRQALTETGTPMYVRPPTPPSTLPRERWQLDRAADELAGRALELYPNDAAAARQWVAQQTDEDPEIVRRAMGKIGRTPSSGGGTDLDRLRQLLGLEPGAPVPGAVPPVTPDRIQRFDKR